jgi:hypothetical protein
MEIKRWVDFIIELQSSLHEFSDRKLLYMTRWALELIGGISSAVSDLVNSVENHSIPYIKHSTQFLLAQTYFDSGEYLRCHDLLMSIPSNLITPKERFLKIYSLYVVCFFFLFFVIFIC